MPYKHFKADIIERVISEVEKGRAIEHLEGCAADVSTMRRWVTQFKERGAQAVGWLISTLLTVYDVHIGSIELRGGRLLKQLARLLYEYHFHECTGRIIGRTNIILTTHNCGFL